MNAMGYKLLLITFSSRATTAKSSKPAVVLRFTETDNITTVENRLRSILQSHPGSIPVLLFYPATDKKVLLEKRFWTTNSEEINSALTNLLGKENVVLQSVKSTDI